MLSRLPATWIPSVQTEKYCSNAPDLKSNYVCKLETMFFYLKGIFPRVYQLLSHIIVVTRSLTEAQMREGCGGKVS